MGQSFFASEGTIIRKQDASGNWSWEKNLSTLSPAELRIVENFRKHIQQRANVPSKEYFKRRSGL
jgi:hypothetical protein